MLNHGGPVIAVVYPADVIRMTNSSSKKWFSFSIRTLLIFVTIIAVFLAWFSHLFFFEYRQSRSSANIIQAAGGTVSWSSDTFFRDATFPFIAHVDLQNCELNDEVYAALGMIPDYYFLKIDSEILDQDTLRKLVEIKHLSCLSLDPGPVEETSIRQFQKERPDIIVTVGFLGGSECDFLPSLGVASGQEVVPGQILGRIEPRRREQMNSPWLEPGTVIDRPIH